MNQRTKLKIAFVASGTLISLATLFSIVAYLSGTSDSDLAASWFLFFWFIVATNWYILGN
ncbi:MAG: hypothetical protein GY943_24540 [Chloroflexi bacterium]|nr:hypothetical protein [Chloroflexota bacterium]